MRLIDADALFKKVKTECNPYGKPTIGFEDGQRVMNWIEQAPTVSGWVSVKDRMPEFEGDYLVTDGHSVPWKCRMTKLGESKGFLNSALNPVVKYWMPLPEPPEVSE